MPEASQVHIVIPSFNRPDKLRGVLRALARQSYTRFSVVVVDDGSLSHNRDEIRRICAGFAGRCELIEQTNRGAAAALNTGIAQCPDGIIIILDDDIEFESTTVEQHVKFQKEYGPCIVSGEANSDPKRASTDIEKFKIWMEKTWMEKRPETLGCVQVNRDNFIVTTANTSFMKQLFVLIGGFNEKLKDGYDVDFGIRALLLNVPVWFDRSIKSIHNDQITLQYYAKRQLAYDESKRRILTDQPDLQNFFKIHVSSSDSSIKKFVYYFLRKNAVVNFIERSSLMKLFPRKMRYRIYGSTIAALSSPQHG